jgi:hypothetical protein
MPVGANCKLLTVHSLQVHYAQDQKKVAVPVFEYLGTATAPSRNKALEQTSAYPTMRKRMTQEQ